MGTSKSSSFLYGQESIMAAGPGFEPGQTDPESAVLPLHHPAGKTELSFG